MKNAWISAVTLALLAIPALPGVAQAQLQPPPPMGAPAQNPPGYPGGPAVAPGTNHTSGTVAQLNNAESEDSGRRLELVYASADVGGGFVSGGGGGIFGFGGSLGVRLVSFTLGARVRDYLGDGNSLLVNGEAAYHLVLGAGDFVLGAHGGYITSTSAAGGSGGNVGLDIGYDHYLTSLVSLGVHASPDMIFAGGDPVFAIFGGPRLGFHFGL